MKDTKILFGFVAFMAAATVFSGLGACGSDPRTVASQPGNSGKTVSTKKSSGPAYTGDGGKGKSITILPPKAAGLAKDQDYLPGVVQGELVSNFTGYSAISVLDREKLDSVYDELFSGYYDENAEASGDLGRLAPTEYLMGGSITKTASGYALQLQITKTADKITAASYSGTCTFAELDNLSGVRRAALDLLQKMGVEPTARTLAELGEAATANQAAAQIALSKGIDAMRKGTVVEALSYYYEAASFDSSLLEAANRASVVSTAISSGNIGENVRNDIQRRKEWQKILAEAEDYFSKHLPWEIVYNPTLTKGKIDYAKETVDLSFPIKVQPTESLKVLQDLVNGLQQTGKAKEWGFEEWPIAYKGERRRERTKILSELSFFTYAFNPPAGLYTLVVLAEIKNERGVTISTCSIKLNIGLGFPAADSQYITEHILYTSFPVENRGDDWVRVRYHNEYPNGHTPIKPHNSIENVVFKDVNANDITDTMTVKIVSVNGIDAAAIAKTGYIKISTGEVKE